MNILLVGNEWSVFEDLAKRLGEEKDTHLIYAGSGDAGLELLKNKGKEALDLVVVGGHLSEMAGIRFIRQLVRINPLVNTVLAGTMSDKEFHEETEGLGVLLQLPLRPTKKDAERLLAALRKISGPQQPQIAEEAKQ